MLICGRFFSTEEIESIKTLIKSEPKILRGVLSRNVCTFLDWRSPNGRLKEMSCRKALLKLEKMGLIKLPKVKKNYHFQKSSNKCSLEKIKIKKVSCSLNKLGFIEVMPVSSRYSKDSRVWKSLLEEYHYLGSGPLCGGQIRYLVRSEKYGWIGALSFSGATWCLKDRDKLIGWSEGARRANLQKIVCNSRFLILPTIKVKNLASHVLSLCMKRLSTDWTKRYGYSPVLLETFVDPSYFKGICYQAANWTKIGQTAGRKTSFPNGKVANVKKDIYIYPLQKNWKSVLKTEPVIPFRIKAQSRKPSDWSENEFGSVDLYDNRLKKRLLILAKDFFAQPGVLVPQACGGSVAKMKGAYRFFDNKQINMKTLLKPHIEATIGRIKDHKIVLAVQDTTSLNYTANTSMEGIGPINTTKDNGVGLILHDTLAFSTNGTPLGLLDVQCWARDPEKVSNKKIRNKLPIDEKESIKWINSYDSVKKIGELCPETMLVSVGDREADIYELFCKATQTPSGPKLLIRSCRNRKRKVEDVYLWDKMKTESLAGNIEIHIPRSGSRKSRTAKLEVRFSKVKLNPPRDKKLPSVSVWAVYVNEVEYGANIKSPLEWMLLTTVEVNSFEDAVNRVEWYSLRWGIEIYHRTIKSGCRIQDRLLDNADRLEACLAIDLVVGWRIFYLTKQSRETPDIPCDEHLSEDEWKVLCIYVKNKLPPKKPPSLREAVRMIASLGGFLGRKGDGEPGTTTTWRGLQRLGDITRAYILCENMQKQRDGP